MATLNTDHTTHPGVLSFDIDPGAGYCANLGLECIIHHAHRRVDFETCAKNGCSSCILAHEAAAQCWPDMHIAQAINRDSNQPFSSLQVRQQRRAYHTRQEKSVQFFVADAGIANKDCNFSESKVKGPSYQRLIPCDTRSDQTLQTARNWLSTCDSAHVCRGEESRLPRRLLEVRDDKVHIYESSNEKGRYATLSHRWGTSETMLCTTTTNIARFEKQIQWDLLPRNFQDAIKFVRSLDLDYIWIDSLCIIQDSALDWQEQSAQMAAIYQHSYVTIAAAITAQPSDGFFTKEGDKKHLAYRTPGNVTYEGREYPVYCRIELDHRSNELPLYERGWVYQERLLSPRIIHFVGEELVWECREAQDCECGSSEAKTTFNRSILPAIESGEMDDKAHALWRTLVSSYSELNLTYESDALPALSGLASAFSRLTGGTRYAAGNWCTSNLLPDLLWYRIHVRPQPPGADVAVKPWRAPSWSWVSARFTPGRVKFAPMTEGLCGIRDVTTIPSGANPYGQLETGYIRLVAHGVTTFLQRSDTISDCSIIIAGRTIYTMNGSHPSIASSGIHDVMPEIFGLHNRDLYKDRLPLEVKVLQLARYVERQQQVRYYLVIAPGAEGKGQWERVGIMAVPEQQGIYGSNHSSHTSEQRAEGYEREAEGNRRLFRVFEEAPLEEYVVH